MGTMGEGDIQPPTGGVRIFPPGPVVVSIKKFNPKIMLGTDLKSCKK